MRHTLPLTAFALAPLVLVANVGALPQVPSAAHPSRYSLGWPGYARDPSHEADAPVAAQSLNAIHWSTPIDLNPQYSGGELLIHYGSPIITAQGTIVVTTKTGASGGFRVEGHASTTGAQFWTLSTDFILAPHNWTPSCGCTLRPSDQLAIPGAGGTVWLRSHPDSASGSVQRVAFYGLANYQANPTAYNNNVMIDTPITSDAEGNLFFGFVVLGSTPIGLQSGIARIALDGTGSWSAAHTVANDANMQKVTYNCAPALSRDGNALYFTVNDTGGSGFSSVGYLVKVDSHTLAPLARVRLKDAHFTGSDAWLPDDGTASPCVGPDGDVYIGVLENPFPANNDRGWMLHFDGSLAHTKIAGAFGWDDTASIVPKSAVPSYTGSSSYLILTKYNNYAGVGGNGHNKVAVLDPNASMTDPISGATVMKEVITVLGVTPDPNAPGGVTEWCINTAVVDAAGKCALINNEDGKLYRWSFVTNSLTQTITLTSGLGEAYTPTLVGPDGVVYAVNNATLFAVGN